MASSILAIFGTRPEAIKVAPLVAALRREPSVRTSILVTGQHRELLDQVLRLFKLEPDADLDVMTAQQALPDLTGRILKGVTHAVGDMRPDAVVVHGDTTTTFASALAAFYAAVPVFHLEAGYRTGQVRLVGDDSDLIVRSALDVLDAIDRSDTLPLHQDPLVEGGAASRAVAWIVDRLASAAVQPAKG